MATPQAASHCDMPNAPLGVTRYVGVQHPYERRAWPL
jgi:hypothetical protein